LSLKNNIDGLSVICPQNHWDDLSGLASKLVAPISPDLTSKPVAWAFRFRYQNRQPWFGDLGLKITAIFSLFELQN
jgi:hypothetical protein